MRYGRGYPSRLLAKAEAMTWRAYDLLGERFGSWLVLRRGRQSKTKNSMWLCRCDCGTERIVQGTNLVWGKSKSCGCQTGTRLSNVEAGVRNVESQYRARAKRIGVQYTLTKHQFAALIRADCFYCGSGPRQVAKRRGRVLLRYNGIDRVNNSQGYAADNCVPCCGICNQMKNDSDQAVFFDRISRIYGRCCK
jgi:hypothetical protein